MTLHENYLKQHIQLNSDEIALATPKPHNRALTTRIIRPAMTNGDKLYASWQIAQALNTQARQYRHDCDVLTSTDVYKLINWHIERGSIISKDCVLLGEFVFHPKSAFFKNAISNVRLVIVRADSLPFVRTANMQNTDVAMGA